MAPAKFVTELEDSQYEVAPQPCVTFTSNMLSGGARLCTVIEEGSEEYLQTYLLEGKDDVFTEAFLDIVVLWRAFGTIVDNHHPIAGYNISIEDATAHPAAKLWGTKILLAITSPVALNALDLSPGPYVLKEEGLFKVYRSYEDTQSAFISSVIPEPKEGNDSPYFHEINPVHRVPVPPRIYSHSMNSHNKPLAGLRFGVKDIFDLAGTHTSAGCRAFRSLYGRRGQTAAAIEKLLILGAIVVGKTKTTQFANGEDAQEWIDYPCPWNPRGDGYQNPDSSSTGSAVAVASYEWLDFAIGSDTCGSISCPAAQQGIFGLRPSIGSISLDGMLGVSKYLDTAGILARDLQVMAKIARAWYSDLPGFVSGKKPALNRILYPLPAFKYTNSQVQKQTEEFIAKLETVMGVTHTVVDLERQWAEDDPSKTGRRLSDYMSKTSAHLHLIGMYENTQPFHRDYQKAFKREPYIHRVNARKWEAAEEVLRDHPQAALTMVKELHVFTNWLESKVLKPDDKTQSIMVWPFSGQEPLYRDAYPPLTAHVDWKWDLDYTAPLAGLPHITVPIDQFSYHSRITGTMDYLPTAVAVVSPRYSDFALLDLLESIPGIAKRVDAGRYSFKNELQQPANVQASR